MTSRYARQTVLPEIGNEGQSALGRARVLVIGAGGLGSPALLYLVAAGVGLKNSGGCIGIIDDDTVDHSNLQRQILFAEADAGSSKADSASTRLFNLNRDCHLRVFNKRLAGNNVLDIFADFDIIVDGSDNFDTKYLINDAAVKLGLPVVYGSILGFEGQASVFWAEHGPCYRCIYPTPPESHVPNCAEAGTLGGIAGMIGSIQAVEVCKLALSLAHCKTHGLEPLIGKLLLADAHGWDVRTLVLTKQRDCPVCSHAPESITMPSSSVHQCTVSSLQVFNLNDLTELIQSGKPFTLIDVREQHEWESGHLEGALHIPLNQLLSVPDTLDKLNTFDPILIYCQHGMRSKKAVQFLGSKAINAISLNLDWSNTSLSSNK